MKWGLNIICVYTHVYEVYVICIVLKNTGNGFEKISDCPKIWGVLGKSS